MKTFLYSIPNRIQSFSKKLDVKAVLCGKSWEVFNDEGVKQLFIFNEDGSILITNNGKVSNASWKFISQNSSILLSTSDETIMFRPAFFNKDVFALQQDGTERYLLMIDEEKKPLFQGLSLDTLTAYIEKEITETPTDKEEKRKQLQFEKEQQRMERERQRQIEKQKKEEEENKKQMEKLQQEANRNQQLKYQEQLLIKTYIGGHKDEIKHKLAKRKKIGACGIIIGSLLFVLSFFIPEEAVSIWMAGVAIIVFIVFVERLFSTPIDIIRSSIEHGVFYHSDYEVRKMYEED